MQDTLQNHREFFRHQIKLAVRENKKDIFGEIKKDRVESQLNS